MVFQQGERKFTYADYITLNEGERVEIIDGDVYKVPPSLSRKHQKVLRELSTEFNLFLRDKDCEVYFAPFAVRLQAEKKLDDEVYHFVQPDLTIVCDKKKLDKEGCKGTPDLIIEILSPSSVKLDRWKKFQLYEKVGVKEYWIVDALNESIEAYYLIDQKYEAVGVFMKEDTVPVQTLKGFEIELKHIFKV